MKKSQFSRKSRKRSVVKNLNLTTLVQSVPVSIPVNVLVSVLPQSLVVNPDQNAHVKDLILPRNGLVKAQNQVENKKWMKVINKIHFGI